MQANTLPPMFIRYCSFADWMFASNCT